MAAWGGASAAWANQVEEAEAAGERLGPMDPSMPSLRAGVEEAKKEKQKSAPAPKVGKKKGKGQAMTLDNFLNSAVGGAPAFRAAGPTLMNLPKAPSQRDDDDDDGRGDYTRLGGAFKDYGGDRGGRGGDRYGDRDGGDRRGGRGGFDRDDDRGDRRRGERDDEERGPSRSETAGAWDKKPIEPGPPPRRGGFDDDRRGGYEDRRGGDDGFRERRGRDDRDDREDMGPSRADESDNWGTGKKFVPSEPREERRGYGDRYDDRRGGYGDRRGGGDRYDDRRGDRYDDRRGDRYDDRRGGYGDNDDRRGGFGDRDRDWGARGGDRDSRDSGPDNWRRAEPEAAAPAERPRLNLAKRSVPVEAPVTPERDEDNSSKSNPFGGAKPVAVTDVPDKAPEPRSAKPEREEREFRRKEPERVEPERSADRPAERPKLNLKARSVADPPAAPAAAPAGKGAVFGGARPREEVLTEQGRDWRKEELGLGRIDRPESDEEKTLKEEIEALKEKVSSGEGEDVIPAEVGGEEDTEGLAEMLGKTVSQQLLLKEAELEKLTTDLDDKLRYSRKRAEEQANGKKKDSEDGWEEAPTRRR
eukprot:CAMPEP_0197864916 /NCGR_PEP_ID=MMETSP1438-20131217/43360_1 /TAXON_ID=1461541 /ORGANISM="Pterosperma sp., Strain CCMP1384" /LENGTH=585 /DNA_ID=CAMNT_0043483295 /DNA_START=74 /DNA_END=1831 /DNA_ORIENTATION=-